jgi:holliday junction DNA helicase RuvA
MIGHLRGRLAHKSVDGIVVDVGGVGYEIFCPLTVLDRLPPEGQECVLSIHTHAREDQLALFGFIDRDERALFRMLTSVTGIGPKLGLTCLSGLSAGDLSTAIADADVKKLSSIPGIGKRTAERLILELKDKVGRVATPGRPRTGNAHLEDLDSALRNLGYRAKEVESLTAGLAKDAAGMDFEALLRLALQRLNT